MHSLRGGQLARVVFIAAVVEAVIVVVGLVANFVTKSAPGTWQVFLVPAVGVLTAAVRAGVEAVARRPGAPKPPPPPAGGFSPGRVPVLVVAAILLGLVGGGGLAVTAGVRYAYGWVTGHETGTEVFRGEASSPPGRLRLTVTRVVATAHFTKVDVTAANSGTSTVTLPVYGNSQLVGEGGMTLEGDPLRSQWSNDVTAGVTRAGTITFPGKLPAGDATLSFATVFGPGALGVESLSVRGILIHAP